MMWVHETFQQTLQGEGMWAGTPVDFIRLSGCPVGCHFCDTGYANVGTKERELPRVWRSIAELVKELRSPRVVISGGEPFAHKNLGDLCEAINQTQRSVNIETSGVFWQEVPKDTWITLSPKQHINPKYPVCLGCWQEASEIKLVISEGWEVNYYLEKIKPLSCQIFLQPEWKMRDRTIPLTLELLKRHPTYRLSLQIHKLLKIP